MDFLGPDLQVCYLLRGHDVPEDEVALFLEQGELALGEHDERVLVGFSLPVFHRARQTPGRYLYPGLTIQ